MLIHQSCNLKQFTVEGLKPFFITHKRSMFFFCFEKVYAILKPGLISMQSKKGIQITVPAQNGSMTNTFCF